MTIHGEMTEKLSKELEKPRLCVDCKFFKRPNFIDRLFGMMRFGKCGHEAALTKSNRGYAFVIGKCDESYSFAATMRDLDWLCGPEGKLWQKKGSK